MTKQRRFLVVTVGAALTAVPGGIRVVWGAIPSTDSSDPNQDLNTALATDGGASWALTPGSIVPPCTCATVDEES